MTVYEDTLNGLYNNPAGSYPEKPDKPMRPGPSAGSVEYREYAKLLEKWEILHAEYLDARTKWRADEGALIQKMRTDLEIEHDLVGHQKAGDLWSRAWDRGHSSGLAEVAMVYDDLVELVK